MKLLESLSAAALVMLSLPLFLFAAAAVVLQRRWPLSCHAVLQDGGTTRARLRFNTAPGATDRFLRRLSLTWLPSLLQVVAGQSRIAEVFALMERKRR